MKIISSEKNIIYGAIIIFFIFMGLLFHFTNKKNNTDDGGIDERIHVTQSPTPSEIPMQIIPKSNQIKIQEDKGNNTFVRYEKGLFIPGEITIKNETGCFVEIQNVGNTDVIPRLGPYHPQKE